MGVLLVLGADRFLAREAVALAVADHPDLEFTRFDGGDVVVARALDELRTPTLFGTPRGVVVENAGDLLSAESLDALAAYAEKPVAGTLLVLQAASLDRRFKVAKRLAAAAEVVRCDPIREWEVVQWIAPHASRRHGLRVDRDAAEALRQRVGEDLGLLDAALGRLAAQIAPRKELRAADVVDSTESHRSPSLFEAANAVEAADLQGALRALDGAFGEGIRINQDVVNDQAAVAPILLSNLHRAYVKLLRFHMGLRGGDSEADAAKAAGVSPKATSFFLQRARRHRLDRLVARHHHFLEADLALKGQRGPEAARPVLERLMVALLS